MLHLKFTAYSAPMLRILFFLWPLHHAVAAPGVIVIDNTAANGAPAVMTNLHTGTVQANTCTQQKTLAGGECNSFASNNLQAVQRGANGDLRLDIGVDNPLSTQYSSGTTATPLNYFKSGSELFDLEKFRRAADALAKRPPTTSAPAGTYGTMDWRQFLTNIANDRTMYGLVRVKVVLLKVPGNGNGDCTPRHRDDNDDDEHENDDAEHKARKSDDQSSQSHQKAAIKASFKPGVREKETGDKESHGDDDDHRANNECTGQTPRHTENEDDEDHKKDDERGAKSSDDDKSTVSKLMARATGMLSSRSRDTAKSSSEREDDEKSTHQSDNDDRHHYVMCGTPRHHTHKGPEREDDHHVNESSDKPDAHSASDDSKIRVSQKARGLAARSVDNPHAESADKSSDDAKKEPADDEHEDDEHEDEHTRRVCQCQPRLNQLLKGGQRYCDNIDIKTDAIVRVRGALLFDFVDEDGNLLPKRTLPTPNELPMPLNMPLHINASRDVSNTMAEIGAIAHKTRTIACANGKNSCPINLSITLNDVPLDTRDAYAAANNGTALTNEIFNRLAAADRYHLQMPSGYARGWLEAFRALGLSPGAWHALGFKKVADTNSFTLDIVRSDRFEDIPALMYQGGLVRLSNRINISGMVYVPEVLVIEQSDPALTQYINGAVLVRDGFYMGTQTDGTLLLSHDRAVHDHMPLSRTSKVNNLYVAPQNALRSGDATGTTGSNTTEGMPMSTPKRGAEWVEVRAR
ncbi:MAG: hypothetical protein AABY83_12820 [Pseudomonadota bacterium]